MYLYKHSTRGQRHLAKSKLCHICNTPEAITHIFLECETVRKMWLDLGVIYAINHIINNGGGDWLVRLKELSFSLRKTSLN